jgi:hypothetical protein
VSLFSPTRDQSRRFFVDAWRKYRAGEVLSPLESVALDLMLGHPEYHALLADEETALARDFPPEAGETNPFLHLALHLAIEEQLSIGQPPGLRAAFDALARRSEDRHDAQHAVMECLAEQIWQTQRNGVEFDGPGYVECIRRRAR